MVSPAALKVQEVAFLLKISPRSVYRRRWRLGGFYPLGLRCLRFPAGVVYACLEGAGERLAVSIPGRGQEVQQGMVSHQGGSQGSRGGAQGGIEEADKDPNRWGLLRVSK